MQAGRDADGNERRKTKMKTAFGRVKFPWRRGMSGGPPVCKPTAASMAGQRPRFPFRRADACLLRVMSKKKPP